MILLDTLQRLTKNFILLTTTIRYLQNVSRFWISGEPPALHIHACGAPSRMREGGGRQEPDLCVDTAPGEVLPCPHAGEGGGDEVERGLWKLERLCQWKGQYDIDILSISW